MKNISNGASDYFHIQIVIATHKKYQMPDDKMYLPLHVGAKGKFDSNGNRLNLGYMTDDTGDNISEKNPYFCELTGLYWAWKNLDADYIGLVHYRRYFAGYHKAKDPFERILTSQEMQTIARQYRIVIPKKRKYYIESLTSHYAHTHYQEHLDITRDIIRNIFPLYITSYDKVMKRTWGYMFNMMIMDSRLLDSYCKWLFTILFEFEKRTDIPELSAFQSRFYGRISELIFNVWLDYQITNGLLNRREIKELPCIHMGKIDWVKKGKAFLKAKFMHKKYVGSF